MTNGKPVIPVIVGPTAAGKTELSILLAERIDAEIVSSDSRQIFRQMRIGTAVPAGEQLARIPHHLIGELNIGDEYSAGIFADLADRRIDDILGRGKRAVVTGGSTLYLRALTKGLADIPSIDPRIREKLNDRLVREGAGSLYKELQDVDPAYAATLDESKTQRIVRGLEVYRGSGKPISSYFGPHTPTDRTWHTVVVFRPRPILYRRINSRVDTMMERGLLDEVREVLEYADMHRVDIPPTIGIRELIPVVRGERSLDEGVRLLKRNSRRYAKRQLTWFRDLDGAVWYDLGERTEADIIEEIARDIARRPG